jgi:hypothetical protein
MWKKWAFGERLLDGLALFARRIGAASGVKE